MAESGEQAKKTFQIIIKLVKGTTPLGKIIQEHNVTAEQIKTWLDRFREEGWKIFTEDFGQTVVVHDKAVEGGKGNIIIKKKKKGHAGSHGGSWKVAYADFVTAMMAFFLLMWLTHMVPQETKNGLSDYFKDSRSYLRTGSPSRVQTKNLGTPEVDSQLTGQMGEVVARGRGETTSLEKLAEFISDDVEHKFSKYIGQVMLENTPRGLKIQLSEKDNMAMFEPGSNKLSARGEEMVKMVANHLIGLPNQVIIEGHSDGSPVRAQKFNNWDLSVLRALDAKRVFEKSGISPDQIIKIEGYADTVLFNPRNPADPMNRRINLIVLRKTDHLK
jgi:chemotaxis protein MotB